MEPVLQVDPLSSLEELFGHKFGRPQLLAEALTHRSAAHANRGRRGRGAKGKGSNERLEFIGDRVLGLLMVEWLIERFPREQEGDLGPRLAELVSRQTLVGIAETIGLSLRLTVADNEAKAGVKTLGTVLADAMEAVIGAMYLDAGLDPARRFVRKAWAELIEQQKKPPKDPKTGLQEWSLARGLGLPVYKVEGRVGPSHAPRFTVSVRAGGVSAEAEASSKQDAQRAAAILLLGKLV